MINCLKQRLLYSEKRARDFLFQAIEDIAGREARTIVSRMTREAASLARRGSEREGYKFAAWETAAKAVVNSMLEAGVLLNRQGDAIRPGLGAQATEVAGIESDYRDAVETHLLEILITEIGDVTTRDHTALAHALFRQFDPNIRIEDLEDRVVMLLARLAGRIVLRADGTYAAVNRAGG